jgi:arginyl-tRNA synthetase
MLRRADAPTDRPAGTVLLREEPERLLALALVGFGDAVAQAGNSYEPHRLCGYLFDLAQAFTTFYEQCPVLGADEVSVRESRLELCRLTLDVLVQGLGLLGIAAPEQM